MEENTRAIETLRQEKQATQKSIDTINLSVAVYEEKLKELNEKRNFILTRGGKNADLQMIKKQLEETGADRSKLEDEIIVLWEKIEKVEAKIHEARNDLEQLKKEIDTKTVQIDGRISEIDAKIASLNAAVEAKVTELGGKSGEACSWVQRLQGKTVRPAAVGIEDEKCNGCYFSLPPDLLNKVQEGDAIIKCPNCYRLLYFKEEVLEEE